MFSPTETETYIRMGDPLLFPRGPLSEAPPLRTIAQAKFHRLDRLDRQANKEQAQ